MLRICNDLAFKHTAKIYPLEPRSPRLNTHLGIILSNESNPKYVQLYDSFLQVKHIKPIIGDIVYGLTKMGTTEAYETIFKYLEREDAYTEVKLIPIETCVVVKDRKTIDLLEKYSDSEIPNVYEAAIRSLDRVVSGAASSLEEDPYPEICFQRVLSKYTEGPKKVIIDKILETREVERKRQEELDKIQPEFNKKVKENKLKRQMKKKAKIN